MTDFLESYYVAQALDYVFLMDDDETPLDTICESYVELSQVIEPIIEHITPVEPASVSVLLS
jgi:hypothetical protein